MKEFCKKDIDFQVIKLNNSVDKMIEVMKESHQEVDVVDMSNVQQEVHHSYSYEAVEAEEAEEECRPRMRSYEAEEEYISKKFVDGATKGIASKMKSKKAKC